MTKRFLAIFLCLLMLPLVASAVTPPDHDALLAAFAPDRDSEALRVREAMPYGDQWAVVLQGEGTSHAAGWCRLTIGVYDPLTGALAGAELHFSDDSADYALYLHEGQLYALCVGSTFYQGYESTSGGAWVYQADGRWAQVWPADADQDYWLDRKAQIGFESYGEVLLYRRINGGWVREEENDNIFYPREVETVLEELVWIPTNGGQRYHNKDSCSGMKNPREVSIDQAMAQGFTPCGRCY
ncbi:MAG: hypothetical protein LBN04_11620 [Oscillospiraceae bacterium]|jgi:hypothetical protein|nr:hypothetical protein [Oscillospiraceae bacterium]